MSKKKFILPFTEFQRGWYEIEADSLEEAREIAIAGDFTEDHEPFYKDGEVSWDENELVEATDE